MKQNIISLFIFTTFAIPVYAQRKVHINFGYVQIPDSIASIIDRGYDWGPNDEHASSFIRNLQDGKEHTLINGIYAYSSPNPHHPRKLFIYHNKKLFIFKSYGAFDPQEVIKEYVTFLSESKIPDSLAIKYIKVIYKFLKEEEGQTYGSYIRPTNEKANICVE